MDSRTPIKATLCNLRAHRPGQLLQMGKLKPDQLHCILGEENLCEWKGHSQPETQENSSRAHGQVLVNCPEKMETKGGKWQLSLSS